MREERTFRLARALDLPERVATVDDAGDVVERSDVGEDGDLFFVESRHTQRKVIDGTKRSTCASRSCDCLPHLLPQPTRVAQTKTHRQRTIAFMFHGAGPFRNLHIDGSDLESVALGVFD